MWAKGGKVKLIKDRTPVQGPITLASALVFCGRRAIFEARSRDGLQISAIADSQPDAEGGCFGPIFTVKIKGGSGADDLENFGAAMRWNGKGAVWMDGEIFAYLAVEEGELAVEFEPTEALGIFKENFPSRRLILVEDIVYLAGETRRKCRIEFRPLRKVGDPPGQQENWVGIWYRSDGAVSIIQTWEEFPYGWVNR
jgi:hypothetical protein